MNGLVCQDRYHDVGTMEAIPSMIDVSGTTVYLVLAMNDMVYRIFVLQRCNLLVSGLQSSVMYYRNCFSSTSSVRRQTKSIFFDHRPTVDNKLVDVPVRMNIVPQYWSCIITCNILHKNTTTSKSSIRGVLRVLLC